MPHSLYLGSGFVQHRMRDFDVASGTLHEARASNTKYAITLYRPTISAIKSCMKYSIAEMCISLFVITLFVNSAILIVAANSLGADAANADLPAIYRLFVQTIGQASGTYISNRSLFVSFPKLQSTSLTLTRNHLRPRPPLLRHLRRDSLHHGRATNLRRRTGLAHEALLPTPPHPQRLRDPRHHHRRL